MNQGGTSKLEYPSTSKEDVQSMILYIHTIALSEDQSNKKVK